MRHTGCCCRPRRSWARALLVPDFVNALSNRCWSRATAGKPGLALPDCDEALRLDSRDADAFDSRGFVHLRLNRKKEAIADYNAALRIRSDMPAALYGRGLARIADGDRDGGERDKVSARKQDPDIEKRFRAYGLMPPTR